MRKSIRRNFFLAIFIFFSISFLFSSVPALASISCKYTPRDGDGMTIGPGYPGYVEDGSVVARPWLKTVDSEEECNSQCAASLRICGTNRPADCDPRVSLCAPQSDSSGVCTCCNTEKPSSPMIKEDCDAFCQARPERRGIETFGDESFTCPPLLGEPPAQTGPTPYQFESTTPRLEIPLPTLPNFSKFMDVTLQGEAPNRYLLIPWLGQYIAAIYKYAIGIVGILSGIMIVIGGLLWLTAGGAADRVSTAKNYIESSLVGLVIALTSYLLLFAINPKLTEFDSLKVNYIERVPLSEDWTPLTQQEVQENTASPDSTPTPAGSTTPASTEPTETGENNVPYFAQFRGEWADKCCGSDPESGSCPGYTLKASGCRLTSYSMVLKYYFPDQNIDPGIVSLRGGARCNVNETQLSNGPWGQISIESININKAKELLDQKKPVVILCRPCVGLTSDGSSAHKYKGHYMVLTGHNGDTFNVNDPGSNPNKRISSMTTEMMRNPCNFVPSDEVSAVQERCQNPVSNPSLYYLHPTGR